MDKKKRARRGRRGLEERNDILKKWS